RTAAVGVVTLAEHAVVRAVLPQARPYHDEGIARGVCGDAGIRLEPSRKRIDPELRAYRLPLRRDQAWDEQQYREENPDRPHPFAPFLDESRARTLLGNALRPSRKV